MSAPLGWLDVLSIVLYFIIVPGIGLWATCRANTGNSQGYFLAGQSSNWILIGMSTFATNVGAPMFVGLAGSAAASGIAVTMFEWHAMFMLVILGWIFFPVYRACGCFTMPEYLKLRYGNNRIQLLIAIIATVNTVLALISGQMYAGALFIEQILGWNLYVSMLLILAVTAVYTVMGGLTAVLWTDAIQTVILIVGSIALAVISLHEVGGYNALVQKFPASAANYTLHDNGLYGNRSCGLAPDNSWHIFRSADDGAYPWPGMLVGLTILATSAWCTDQVCVQRSLSAKSVSHAKGGVILAAYLKIISFIAFIIPGMISRVLFPDEVACADPVECERICDNAGGCTNIAYPLLVNRILPNGIRGLMLAALLSALMSSLTSLFNSASTVFTLDIWSYFRHKPKERELMIVGRVYTVFLVIVSFFWVPILQALQGSNFWDYTQSIYSHILPPIVVSFYLGLLWPRATEQGAFWSTVISMVIGVSRLILTWVTPAPLCGSGEEDYRWAFVAKVHYLHFAMILGTIAAILHVGISLVTKPRSQAKLRRVTFWTRNDPELQEMTDDEEEDKDTESCEKETLDEDINEDMDEDTVIINHRKCGSVLKDWVCGASAPPQKISKEERRLLQKQLTNIEENPKIKRFLDVNGILCVAVAVFLHAFWY